MPQWKRTDRRRFRTQVDRYATSFAPNSIHAP